MGHIKTRGADGSSNLNQIGWMLIWIRLDECQPRFIFNPIPSDLKEHMSYNLIFTLLLIFNRKFRVPECMRKPFSIPSLVLCPTWDDSTASSSPAPTRHNATSPRLPPFPIMTIHQCPIPAQLDYFQYRLLLELQFLHLMMCYCDLSRPRFMFYNNQDAL